MSLIESNVNPEELWIEMEAGLMLYLYMLEHADEPDALILDYLLHDRSRQEAADALGVNVSTVTRRLHRMAPEIIKMIEGLDHHESVN